MPTTDNVPLVFDSKWRAQLKADILEKIRKRHPAIDRGLQIEGCTLDNPTEENLAILIVLQEIVTEHREFSIVQWAGGVALVRTAQVDRINKDFQEVNETSNFIIRGGTDKAADLMNNVAVASGTYEEDK